MQNSHLHDMDITGTILSVTADEFGPALTVNIEVKDGLHLYRFENLPTPNDADYKDYWQQYIGNTVRVTKSIEMTVEVFP